MGKSIGETLRDGRLHQRLSISECAKRTHISARYLEALEEERWRDLPSESHRMGFLRLYARFLGVYSEDLIQAYRVAQQPPPVEKPAEQANAKSAPKRHVEHGASMTPQKLILVIIVALVSLWGVYHGARRWFPDPHVDLSWLKFRTREPRMNTAPKPSALYKLRAKADADTWLRVTEQSKLIFEGILPAGATKEWSGTGPFRVKAGNTNAISLFWNDQPVDLKSSMRANVADVTLPPS